MNHEQIIIQFRKKKRNTIIIGVVLAIALLTYFIYCELNGIELPFLILGTILLVLPINIFIHLYWTCPNCNKYLGTSFRIDRCAKCECSFKKDDTIDKISEIIGSESARQTPNEFTNNFLNPPHIPNYEKYDIYSLVEIYNRINHDKNREKIKLIDQQIRKKLNISQFVDFSSPDIQVKFNEILEIGPPLNENEKENYDILRWLNKLQLILILVVIGTSLLFLIERDMFLIKLMISVCGLIIVVEFVESLFTIEIITIWRTSISKINNPISFRLNQIILLLLSILILFFQISDL